MTISRILNSFNFYTPRIQAEPQIQVEPQAEIKPGNTVHTWHLVNGSKAYLIRNNDVLECQLINDRDFIKVQVPFPDFLTPEEAVARLVEKMYPILLDNDTIDFIKNEEELHTWDVKYGNPVSAVRLGEELYYRTIWEGPEGEKSLVQEKICTPDSLSLSEQVEWVLSRYPHVYAQKDSCFVTFEDKIAKEKSAIDGKTLLDMNNWCVTMFNTEDSGTCPCTWVGHASLVVEAIEEGGYFARSIHLTKEKGVADIRFFEVFRENLITWTKKVSKTETWSRPKEDIQRMINQVFLEFTHQKNGDPLIFFEMRGDQLPFLMRDFVVKEMPLENDEENPFNCIKYSRRNLRLANIKPILRSGCRLSNRLLQTPLLYTGSRVKAIGQEAFMMVLYTGYYGTAYSLLLGVGYLMSRVRTPVLATIVGVNIGMHMLGIDILDIHGKKTKKPSKAQLENA